MRVSIEPTDPGVLPYARLRSQGKDVRVFLDGKPLTYVVTADDQTGFVRFYTGAKSGDGWAQVDRTGVVTIETYDRESAQLRG